MRNNIALVFVLLAFALNGFSQSTENKKTSRPDIPGTFTLELGVNQLLESPNKLKYGFWGSRAINLYYQYDLRIGSSKFTFHPGIGLGMDRFKFLSFQQFLPTDTVEWGAPTLAYDNAGNTAFIEASHYIYDGDTLDQADWSDTYETSKSMLALNYVDIPLEFRFNTNPEDLARSFKVAVGGKVGYLIGSHTKLKYKENGDQKKLKNDQDFNLNPFRYSAYLKIYIGNFGFFGNYNINPMFKDQKGPAQTKTSYYTVGISLTSF